MQPLNQPIDHSLYRQSAQDGIAEVCESTILMQRVANDRKEFGQLANDKVCFMGIVRLFRTIDKQRSARSRTFASQYVE